MIMLCSVWWVAQLHHNNGMYVQLRKLLSGSSRHAGGCTGLSAAPYCRSWTLAILSSLKQRSSLSTSRLMHTRWR